MINLKYSKDVSKDYTQLSEGRKQYITKRSSKMGFGNVSAYLLNKYIIVEGIENPGADEEQK